MIDGVGGVRDETGVTALATLRLAMELSTEAESRLCFVLEGRGASGGVCLACMIWSAGEMR